MNKKSFLNNNTARFIILTIILWFCWYLGKYFSSDFKFYKGLISNFPVYLKGLIFVFLYSGVTFFAWLTKDLFKILGAVLFGAYQSTLFIWIAEIINATVLFHLSRKLGRGFVEGKTKGRLASLDSKIESSGFWGVFVLRIVPLVPFRILDLAAGLTKISFRNYMTAVLFASPLRIFWIQFILAAVGEQLLDSNFNMVKFFPILTEYIESNSIVFTWSFAYLIAATILMIWLRRKSKVKT